MADTKRRVTSFDVASLAGVSQSTVSRALAGSSTITDATRERVVGAARELGYFVDERAARLRRGRTGVVAVVVIYRRDEAASDINPFAYALLGNICREASARGFETLVSFQAEEDDLFGHYVERREADGLVVIGTTENTQAWRYFQDLARAGTHLACWGSPSDDLDWIRSDNVAGGRLAVDHLAQRGYRRIACVGSTNSPQQQFGERYAGYVEGMEHYGFEPRLVEIDENVDRAEQGRRAVADLIESGEEFDAVFAVCDAIALGALEELRKRDFDVPGRIGLVGFDGIRAGLYSSPPLTTIETDLELAGRMLIDAALEADGVEQHTRVPVNFVTRGSTR